MDNFYKSHFGGFPNFRANRQNRDVIDVSYSEVNDKAESKVDELLRSRQIADAAVKCFPIKDGNSCVPQLVHSELFSMGASWADENPRSNYQSITKWHVAVADGYNKQIPDVEAAPDPILNATLLLAFCSGADWAVENPFKRV